MLVLCDYGRMRVLIDIDVVIVITVTSSGERHCDALLIYIWLIPFYPFINDDNITVVWDCSTASVAGLFESFSCLLALGPSAVYAGKSLGSKFCSVVIN